MIWGALGGTTSAVVPSVQKKTAPVKKDAVPFLPYVCVQQRRLLEQQLSELKWICIERLVRLI